MMPLGDQIKFYRERALFSQSRLARLSGFDHSYISRLEAGGRMPTRESIDRIIEVLQFNPKPVEARMTDREAAELLQAAGFVPDGVAMVGAGTIDSTREFLGQMIEQGNQAAALLRLLDDGCPHVTEGE